MIGDDGEAVARCLPVFETYGDPVIHLGPLGSGLMAKLMNNLVFTAQLTMALETFEFADELGVDRKALAEVLTHGSGSSRSAGILAMSGFDTIGISQSIGLLQKEARIVREVTGSLGATEPASVVALAERTLDRLGGGS